MKTKTLLHIDNLIFKPIAFMMNFLVRLVGKILRIDHSLDKKFKRIVVSKFKGIGSIIQATPMLQAMREQFPDAEIIFVSTKSNEHFLKKIEYIDTIITVDEKNIFKLLSSVFSSLFKLTIKRPDVYINLEIFSNFSTLFMLFTFSKNRIGYYLRSNSFHMGIYTHMMFFNANIPISEAYLQIARLFKSNQKEVGKMKYPLYPLFKNISGFEPISENKYLVVNPNASDLRLERRWDAGNYNELISMLLEEYKELEIFIIGGKDERLYCEKTIEGIVNPRLKNIAGQTSIDELISIIQKAALLVTNDTGPMHIAFSCGTPTVALFGPASPIQYPGIKNTSIIYKDVYCSPCVHDFVIPPCNGDNICMKLITVSEVFEKTKAQLDQVAIPNALLDDTVYYDEATYKVIGLVGRTDF